MTKCNHEALVFSNCRKRQVWANFHGEPVSSNGAAACAARAARYSGLRLSPSRACAPSHAAIARSPGASPARAGAPRAPVHSLVGYQALRAPVFGHPATLGVTQA